MPSPLPSSTVAEQDAQAREQALANEQARVQAKAAMARLQYEQNYTPRDPWRELNGTTNYIRKEGVEFCGKVLEVQPGGIRVSGDYSTLFRANYWSDIEHSDLNSEFFVANFPFEVAEDEVISESKHLMAWYIGTYTYHTVNGGSRTIRKLDYGKPCDEPAEEILKDQQAARAIELAKAQAEQKSLEKKQAVQARAVAWLQPQATNGDASAQCSLGLHYLSGQGCETNREQAIYWLQKSAAQGYIEASNKLASLQK